MPHARTQIRDAVVAALTGLATTGPRVHASRMRPQDGASLPCLLVHANDTEQVEAADVDTEQQRDLPIVVRGFAKAVADLDDTLDQIALEVETALALDPRLGGLCASSFLRSVDVDYDDTTNAPVGEIALTYQFTYHVHAGSPGTPV